MTPYPLGRPDSWRNSPPLGCKPSDLGDVARATASAISGRDLLSKVHLLNVAVATTPARHELDGMGIGGWGLAHM